MTTNTIVLNSSNVIGNNNSIFSYKFQNGAFKVPEGSQICVSQIQMPYSWFNVSSRIGNNILYYYIPNSSNVQVQYQVTLTDGFYDITALNNALQSTMKTNGHYWYSEQGSYSTQFQFSGYISGTTLTISSSISATIQLIIGTSLTGYGVTSGTVISAQTGPYTYTVNNSQTVGSSGSPVPLLISAGSEITPSIIYPLTLASYPTLYTNSVTSITIPSSSLIQNILGSTFYYANGLNGQNTWTGGYPTSGNQCAYITFPTTNSSTTTIGNLLGYTSSGTNVTAYPSNISSLTVSSQTVYGNSLSATPPFAPIGSTVNSILVSLNIAYNLVSPNSFIIDSFPVNSTFGSNISYLPISNNYCKISAGTYNELKITLTDQNGNTLYANDPNVLIVLLIQIPEIKK